VLYILTLLDDQAYAIPATHVAEVLPLVRLPRSRSADGVATFRYRGRLAAAVDLSWMLLGRPCEARVSTRVLVMRRQGEGEFMGLVTENVTETLRIDDSAFQPVQRPGEPDFLGPSALVGAGWVRRIEVGALLRLAVADRPVAA